MKHRINFTRVKNSITAIKENNKKLYLPCTFFITIFFFWLLFLNAINKINNQTFTTFLTWFSVISAFAISVIGILMILTIIGTPKGTKSIESRLKNISFCDKSGNTPMLMRLLKDNRQITLIFYSPTIPKIDFVKKQEAIENALNISIVNIQMGKDLQEIIIEAVKGDSKLPELIMWQNNYISPNDGEIVLGETLLDKYLLDFNRSVHCIVAGGTGSGKTALIKLIAYQFICKKADIYLIDYKGGVDYPTPWNEYCKFIDNDEDFYNVLNDLIEIKDDRNRILKEANCKNIKQYNQKHEYPMKRILVIVDEMAVALSKKGVSKEKKETIEKIERNIEELAKLSRCAGIHLLLGMQRPDATVLSGQIKSNVNTKFLGRSDYTLADIVLDKREYADKIPSDAEGMFVDMDGTVFRAYYFDDEMWG